MMRSVIKERGYQVITAEDEEAFELIECLACTGPHLIVTDLRLPTLEGLVEQAAEHPDLNLASQSLGSPHKSLLP